MILTNKNGLTKSYENLVKSIIDNQPNENIIHVTELINPAFQRKLKIKYWNEIEQDITDFDGIADGIAFHYLLQKFAPKNSFSEENLK